MSRAIADPPHPSHGLVVASLHMARVWTDWLRKFVPAIRHNTPITGTVTFAAATSAAVAFDTAEASTDYNVMVEPPEDRRWWITSKATTGFTINVSSSSSAVYTWTVVRR